MKYMHNVFVMKALKQADSLGESFGSGPWERINVTLALCRMVMSLG